METRILRLPEVIEITGLSRTTVYRLMLAEEFPASVSLGARSIGWSSSEISAWIESRLANRKPANSSDPLNPQK